MHEMSLMQGIIAAAEAAIAPYAVKRVNAVLVRAGVLANIMPDALSFAFEMQSANTVLAGAEFELKVMPLSAVCRDCGREFQSMSLPPACPACGSIRAEISGGQEVWLESIDLEEDDNAN